MLQEVALHARGTITIDDRVVPVGLEQAEAEAEMLRHQRPLDDEPARCARCRLKALSVEAVGARSAGHEHDPQDRAARDAP